MKSNAIVRIIIWGLILLLLVGTLGIFFFARYVRDPFVIASSPLQSEAAVPLETSVGETPVNILPNKEELSLDAQAIDEIEIDWVAGDVLILPKDVDSIIVAESDVSDGRYSMTWKVQNRKLEIRFCKENWHSGIGIHMSDSPSKDLYIYVPMDWAGSSIEIDAASAAVEMQNMTIREMDFDGASGTVRMENCDIQDLDIDTASGDVIFSGTLDTLDFDAASASFIADFYNTPSRIDMDSMSGTLDIRLPENCGYALSMNGMSSRFSSDFQGTATKNDTHVYGDGRCRINVDGLSCGVTIRKGEIFSTEVATEVAVNPTEESAP